MSNSCLKYACLFGGGAIRGSAHVGVVKALEELQIEYDTIAGSSVGAIVAALLAVGFNAEELREIFLQVNFELFRDIHLGFGPRLAISKGEVFLEWLRELIEKKYYGESYIKGANEPVRFKDIEKNLVVITTDLSNFKCREFSKVKTPDFEIASAVRISSSMPGLMKPTEYENTLLVDGDLQKSWPMWALTDTLKNIEERVLEVRLEGDYGDNDMNTIDYFNTVYSCVTSIATEFVLDRYENKDKYDFIVINTGDIVIIDFNQPREKRENLMKIGYEQTIKYFKEYLPNKKDNLFEIYDKLHTMFERVRKEINHGKIIKAKMCLLEAYACLADNIDRMDESTLWLMRIFKDAFLDNIKYPPLWGSAYLTSKQEIVKSCENIIRILKEKLIDLKDYCNLVK